MKQKSFLSSFASQQGPENISQDSSSFETIACCFLLHGHEEAISQKVMINLASLNNKLLTISPRVHIAYKMVDRQEGTSLVLTLGPHRKLFKINV